MAAPIVAANTVALTGSAQAILLATAPDYAGLEIESILLTTSSTAALDVTITNGAGAKLFEELLSGPVGAPGVAHIQPGDTATLNLPSGTGNVDYTVTFVEV